MLKWYFVAAAIIIIIYRTFMITKSINFMLIENEFSALGLFGLLMFRSLHLTIFGLLKSFVIF